MMKKIYLTALIFILAACSFTAASEYNKNFSKWQAAKITHYRYTLSISCLCGFRNDMPLTIEVKNDETASITRADGSLVSSTDDYYDVFEHYATLDNLFVELKSSLDGESELVSALYDTTYGFPTSIAIDYKKAAVDDELFLTIENFEVLE